MPITVSMPEDTDGQPEHQSNTLMSKWRSHYRRSRRQRGARLARAMFVYQACSQLYVSIRYLIPAVYEEYDPWTQYYLKVFGCFIGMNAIANWLCVILYHPGIKKTRDRSDIHLQYVDGSRDTFIPRLMCNGTGMDGYFTINGQMKPVYESDQGELPWKFCDKCAVDIPPRAHHCLTCGTCILKRDHHCYITGLCVGFRNQRYFVILCFYAAINSAWGLYLTRSYFKVNSSLWTTASWLDMVIPFGLYRVVFGALQHHIFILMTHLFILSICGFAGLLYFLGQILLIATNKTMYEFVKNVRVKSTTSINRNFRSVFGDCWALNFLFPAQILFRQRDNGVYWKGLKRY